MATLKRGALRLAPPFAAFLNQLVADGLSVWIVGGWVRDVVRGEQAHDADFCTDADDDAIQAAAKACAVTVLLDRVAQVHGTYRLAAAGETLDLARLRRDVARVGARHAEVSFTQSLPDDLARRDLTINALALPYPLPSRTPLKALIDVHGGQQDLAAKRLQLIGDPAARLQEDPLRLLRIARFACMGTAWTVVPTTLAAMAQHARQVGEVSVERRLAEMQRALALPAPARFFALVAECRAQDALFAEQLNAEAVRRGSALLERLAPHLAAPHLRLAGFLLAALVAADDASQLPTGKHRLSAGHLQSHAAAALALLRPSRAWLAACTEAVAACAPDAASGDDGAVARWAIHLGPEGFADAGLLAEALVKAKYFLGSPLRAQWRRASKLHGKRQLWRAQDLNLDAATLFAQLQIGEGAVRRWLLAELLVHAWLHPKDNNDAALHDVARQLAPTEAPAKS